MSLNALTATNYNFHNQTQFYRGKVRDVYTINNDLLVIVACDRISAFDHVLPRSIPYKGQVLNAIASLFLDRTSDIVQNWKISTPDPHVTIGHRCDALPIEFVVRNYLTGHAWRVYKSGGRILCGNTLPEGLKENDQFPMPIITPATKATSGHDEDTTYDEILKKGIVTKQQLSNLKAHLYKQILISLRMNPMHKNIRIQIREQLDFATILYQKGLYKQSLKVLEKAKILALKNFHKVSKIAVEET